MPQVHAYVYELLFTKRNEACRIVRRTYAAKSRRKPPEGWCCWWWFKHWTLNLRRPTSLETFNKFLHVITKSQNIYLYCIQLFMWRRINESVWWPHFGHHIFGKILWNSVYICMKTLVFTICNYTSIQE